jgi:hypothetical protein
MSIMAESILMALRRAETPSVPNALQVLDCAACPLFAAPAPIPITVGVVLILGLCISYFFQVCHLIYLFYHNLTLIFRNLLTESLYFSFYHSTV